jgi:Ca-activated chloride channel homolog
VNRLLVVSVAALVALASVVGCGNRAPAVVIELRAPAEVEAGASFDIGWAGPDSTGDYITIVPAGTAEGDWGDYAYTREGNPVTLTAPLEPGSYELRYATESTDPDSTLARLAITVKAPEIMLTAPAEVVAGAPFEVQWIGPDGDGYYLLLVPAGTAEGEWMGYEWHYMSDGNPITFTAPVASGAYEIRYATEETEPDSTLFRIPLTIAGAAVSITAPGQTAAGSQFAVEFTGPANSGDYLVMVPQGTAEGEWVGYEWYYVSTGSPLTFTAPADPGVWEIRYATESTDPDSTIHRVTIAIE